MGQKITGHYAQVDNNSEHPLPKQGYTYLFMLNPLHVHCIRFVPSAINITDLSIKTHSNSKMKKRS